MPLRAEELPLSTGPWWEHAATAAAIPAAAVLAGDVHIRDASSRNGVALVTRRGGPGRVVKTGPGAVREGRAIASLSSVVGDPGILPAIVRHDPDSETLVLTASAGSEDLWSLHHRIGRFPPAVGASIGSALAALHRASTPSGFTRDVPPVLTIHRPGVEAVPGMSPALIRLTTAVQGDAALRDGLDAIGRRWTGDAPIHADVRLSNIVTGGTMAGQPAVRLVDWEDARAGDPAWDVGSALAAYVSFWIDSIPQPAPATRLVSADLVASARYPLRVMRPAMRALWDAYSARIPSITGPADDRAARTTLCCGGALVRGALDDAVDEDVLPLRAWLHLQVASNLLADPVAAAERLLGSPR